MSFGLAYIELNINSDVYNIAESYLERGCLVSYSKTGANLYIGSVKTDKQNHDVEINIKAGDITNLSCDCENYTMDAPCAHLATLLIQLRRDTLQEIKPSVKKEQSKVKISHLVNRVDKEELSNFILQYARKNRTFANELKAFLSPVMSESVDSNYYAQLIQSAMRMSRKKDNAISAKGAAHVKIIIEELWLQSEDKIASKKYTEATAILKALSTQIPIAIDKVTKKEPFIDLFIRVLQAFANIPQTLMSPELGDNIFHFLNEDLPMNPIMDNRLDKPYFETLLQLANTSQKKSILKNTIQTLKSQSDKWGKNTYVNLLLFELMIAQEESDKAHFDKIVQDHIRHPDILFHALKVAAESKKWQQVKEFASTGLEQNFGKSLNIVLYQFLYQVAIETKNDKAISEYGQLLYLQTYDNQYLDPQLEKLNKKEQTAFLKNLLSQIEKADFHTMRKEAIADIYLRLDNIDSLIAYIKKIKSLDLLNKVMPLLLKDYSAKLKSLYTFLISDYLSYHLGPVPAQKVKSILLSLRRAGAHNIVQHISGHLIKEFPERGALQEELEIL